MPQLIERRAFLHTHTQLFKNELRHRLEKILRRPDRERWVIRTSAQAFKGLIESFPSPGIEIDITHDPQLALRAQSPAIAIEGVAQSSSTLSQFTVR